MTIRRDILRFGAASAVLPVASGIAGSAVAQTRTEYGAGRDQPLNDGWRFLRGTGEGLESVALDDSAWRTVDLPHDWSIEDLPATSFPDRIGPFTATSPTGASSGFTIGGEGWYRKRIGLARMAPGARAEILFDGVAVECDIWLNGHFVGSHKHSYTPFHLDLTPHARWGADNLIAVRVRNIGATSRWYSGSGIYRPIVLDILPQPERIARWGVAAHTARLGAGGADIDVTTRLDGVARPRSLRTSLRDGAGRTVAVATSPASTEVRQQLRLASPRPWSPEDPQLYTLHTELLDGARVVDAVAQAFGVRVITFSAERGMAINGKPTTLRGGNVHHDNGLLGAAAFADAEERRVSLLKARGFNAIRSAHNPCSRAFREACDRRGMLLIEEAFDTWFQPKRADDYAKHYEANWRADLAAMVLSARNSPSVLMWSIGNEINSRATPATIEAQWRLANEVHRLDPTRPVTAAIHGHLGRDIIVHDETARAGRRGGVDSASTAFLDIPGYNYKLQDFEKDHARWPDRVLYAGESFPQDVFDYVDLLRRAPYFLGEFVWTAMDYIGEAGLGLATRGFAGVGAPALVGFPVVNAFCGDIDLVGAQKPQSLARDVAWGLSPLEILVHRPVPEGQVETVPRWGWPDESPSWTWPGFEGRPLSVRVYTLGDRVELRLNGVVVGEKAIVSADKTRAEILAPYQPGVLEAVSYRDGVEIARRRLETASAPIALRLTQERRARAVGRQGLMYVHVAVLDAAGRIVPGAVEHVTLRVTGAAQLAAFGAAGPLATGSFQSNQALTYNGRALAVLRSIGETGTVQIGAAAGQLAPAVLQLT